MAGQCSAVHGPLLVVVSKTCMNMTMTMIINSTGGHLACVMFAGSAGCCGAVPEQRPGSASLCY